MTQQQFEALVARLEGEARSRPARYRVRVLLIALLGNAYLGAVLILLGALLVAAAASIVVLKALGAKLAIVLGVLFWMVLKALWIRVAPPEGFEVTARDAPELFAIIDALRRELGAPRFHRVLVTEDFNAGVVQAPRLGLFGWHRNYLLVGLPLAKSLSVEQFKAVLAHELGHLARGDGRLSNWIYNQRLRWTRLVSALEAAESRASFLFKPFLRWYAPYFNAYSFPLARANEFQADEVSARLASRSAAAEALTAVNVIGSYLAERYWPRIHRQAEDLPQPRMAPFAGMAARLASEIDTASVGAWLADALARKTTVDDTHPCLGDRLAALREPPRLAFPASGETADRVFGPALERITQHFDRSWRDNILPAWEARHREVQEGRGRLAELDAKHASGVELSLQEAYDRARHTEAFGGSADAALEQFRALHARAPDDPVVQHALGSRLLARDDDAGRALLERAMQLDETETIRCCRALCDYCWRTGREEEAQEWHRRLVARAELEEGATKERDEVRLADKFEGHGVASDALAELQAQLRAVDGLHKAYLVRKRVQHMPERACFVFGFTVGRLVRPYTKRRAAEVLQRIQQAVTFPGETLILNVEGANYRFGRKLRWLRGSRIL